MAYEWRISLDFPSNGVGSVTNWRQGGILCLLFIGEAQRRQATYGSHPIT